MTKQQTEDIYYLREELGKYLKNLRKSAGFTGLSISKKINELYPERTVSTIHLNYLPSLESKGACIGSGNSKDESVRVRAKVADLYIKLVIKNKEQYHNVKSFIRKIDKIKNEITNEKEKTNYDEKLLKLPIEVRLPLENLIDSIYNEYSSKR